MIHDWPIDTQKTVIVFILIVEGLGEGVGKKEIPGIFSQEEDVD